MTEPGFSGGCQCGAVRYRVEGALATPHLCHCRMCQKAAGNYFMPLASADNAAFSLTRGAPRWFFSSEFVKRGFCENCGTPLFFMTEGGDHVSVTLGSLDDPSAIIPATQDGVEGRVTFFHALPGLPERPTDRSDLPGGTQGVAESNRQHPDHDTDKWPKERDHER